MRPDDPRLKNLIPFKKGDPRIATGTLKKGKPHYKTILRRFLNLKEEIVNPLTNKTEKISVEGIMHLKQIVAAMKGNLRAYEAILDRYYGKPTQSIDVTAIQNNFELNEKTLAEAINEDRKRRGLPPLLDK